MTPLPTSARNGRAIRLPPPDALTTAEELSVRLLEIREDLSGSSH